MLHSLTSTEAATRRLVFACAATAGIHAGLVPEHLREEPRLGVAFLLAAVALLAIGLGATLRPSGRRIAALAAVALAGLACAYVASRTSGIPLLAPQAEAVDAVGVASVSIELIGLIYAVRLAHDNGRRTRRPIIQEVTR